MRVTQTRRPGASLRAAPRFRHTLALAGLALAGALGCGHHVENGHYALVADSYDQSLGSCEFENFDGVHLWSGELVVSGQEVNFVFDADGGPVVVASDGGPMRLTGLFKIPQSSMPDGFNADGTGRQVPVPLLSGPCQADVAQVHMDADFSSSDHFAGTLHLEYQLVPVRQPNPCAEWVPGCSFTARFHAVPQ